MPFFSDALPNSTEHARNINFYIYVKFLIMMILKTSKSFDLKISYMYLSFIQYISMFNGWSLSFYLLLCPISYEPLYSDLHKIGQDIV